MKICCPECNTTYDIPKNKLPKPKSGFNAVAKCRQCGSRILFSPDLISEEKEASDTAHVDEFVLESDQEAEPVQLTNGSEASALSAESDSITDDLAAFIVCNRAKYLAKFEKFNYEGIDRFAVTWNWPAFFFNSCWFLYRKLYLWALIAFVVLCISIFNFIFIILSGILFGFLGNYLYYKHAQKKIYALHAFDPSADISSELARIGGVNRWAMVLGITISVITMIVIIALIILPMLASR